MEIDMAAMTSRAFILFYYRLLEQLDDFGVALVVSVGRHQAFEFFKPVEDDANRLGIIRGNPNAPM